MKTYEAIISSFIIAACLGIITMNLYTINDQNKKLEKLQKLYNFELDHREKLATAYNELSMQKEKVNNKCWTKDTWFGKKK